MVEYLKPVQRWKRKISQLDKMALIDCVPNGLAVVLGAAVGAFHVFWAINGPECIDAAWDRVQKPGRKHRKFEGRGFAQGPSIAAAPGSYGASVIPLGNMAQKIGFGFALVDGFLDGVIYGASLARRYSGCRDVTAPYAQLTTGPVVPALLPAQEFVYASWTPQSVNHFGADSSGVAVGAGGTQVFTVAYGINQVPNMFPPLEDCSFTSELIWLPSGTPVRQSWGGFGHNVTGTGVLYGQDIFPSFGDGFLAVKVTKTAGVMFIGSGFLTVTGGRIDSGLATYECGAKLGVIN